MEVYCIKNILTGEIISLQKYDTGNIFLSQEDAARAFNKLAMYNNSKVLDTYRITKYKLVEVLD